MVEKEFGRGDVVVSIGYPDRHVVMGEHGDVLSVTPLSHIDRSFRLSRGWMSKQWVKVGTWDWGRMEEVEDDEG